MSNQQNPITQIFGGGAIAVLSASFLVKLDLEKSNPQPQRFDTPSDNGNWRGNTQPIYQKPQQSISLSHESGNRDGSVSFKLPKEGYYKYNLTVTTTFNSHIDNWQICTHNGYGRGSIFMGDGKVYKMEYDGRNLSSATSSYNAWLSEI